MNRAGLTANSCRITALVASLLTAGCCQPSETTGEFTYEESPSTATLRGVVSLDGLTAAAVGDGGTIVLRDGSPSEGTWTIEDAEVTADLFAITAPDRSAGPVLAVGAGGTILRGFTGGGFVTRVSGVEADLRAITFFATSNNQVVAVGDGVAVLSADQGNTWAPVALPDGTGVLRAVKTRRISEGSATHWEVLAVGDAGRGIFSKDSGESWTAIMLPTDAALIVIGIETFFIYADDGTTWQPSAASLLEYEVRKHEAVPVLSIARNDLWQTTADGIVKSGSKNRGPSDEPREPLLAVDGDSHNAIAVGANGTIVRATLTTTPGCQ